MKKATMYFECKRCGEKCSEYFIRAHLRKCSRIRCASIKFSKYADLYEKFIK